MPPCGVALRVLVGVADAEAVVDPCATVAVAIVEGDMSYADGTMQLSCS